MIEQYQKIVNRKRVYSEKHPQMPNSERAAQFAPFAALTGYDEVIAEMARLTIERIELCDDKISELELRLNLAQQISDEKPELTIVYFKEDERKKGGAYITKTGTLAAVEEYSEALVFTDGYKIPIKNIYDISGECFACLEMLDV